MYKLPKREKQIKCKEKKLLEVMKLDYMSHEENYFENGSYGEEVDR